MPPPRYSTTPPKGGMPPWLGTPAISFDTPESAVGMYVNIMESYKLKQHNLNSNTIIYIKNDYLEVNLTAVYSNITALYLEARMYGARAERQVLVCHLTETRVLDHRLELLLIRELSDALDKVLVRLPLSREQLAQYRDHLE